MLLSCLLLLLIFIAYKIRKRQMTIFERLGIPGPKPNLIFGNAIDVVMKGTSKVFPVWSKKYGPIVGYYIGGRPQIVVTDMELLRQVFIKDYHLFTCRQEVIPGGVHPQALLRKNIAWCPVNAWRPLRSTFTPSFTISKLNRMEPLILKSIEDTIEGIDIVSKSGEEFNFQHFAEQLSFSISSNCFLGVNLSTDQMEYVRREVMKSTRPRLEESILALIMVVFPSLTFIAHPLRVLWETIRLKMMWSPEGVVVDFMKKIVKTRKNTKTKTTDILQVLLDCEKAFATTTSSVEVESVSGPTINGRTKTPLSEDVVVSNSFILFLASFETTSTTLQFIISELVNRQDVQNELREKLKEQIELNDGVANLEVFTKVPLLLHVIKETLRVHPPVAPFVSRLAEVDYEYNGVRFPKGMGVYANVKSIHNDPILWPEPEKFKPERFAEEYNKMAYLAFGLGLRNCIGTQFAYIQLQLEVAHLILRYQFEAGPSTEKEVVISESTLSIGLKNGIYCKAIPLKK